MMKEKLIHILRAFMPLAIMFLVFSLGLRAFENFEVSSKTEHVGTMELAGLQFDIPFALTVILIVMLLHAMIALIHEKTAMVITIFLFSALLFFSAVVIQYFIATMIPLSADVYGYSFHDIRTTVASSGGFNWIVVGKVTLLPAGFIANALLLRRRKSFHQLSTGVLAGTCVLLIISVFLPHHPERSAVSGDFDYFLVSNKTEYFIARTVDYLANKKTEIIVDPNSYPFLHDVRYENALHDYIELGDTKPNVVIIIVEGLGRDFVGDGAYYGGFTPFLDSLTRQSLYWKNALSNAGRTFGALPSILGSLPYGHDGLMSYAKKMPAHQTLISLLKPYGYCSSVFYGGNPNFDNTDLFLEYEGVNRFVNENNFPSTYSKMKTNANGFSWGYGDRDVFEYATEELVAVSGPRIDVYLTLSTHEPFISPDTSFNHIVDVKLTTSKLPEQRKKTIAANNGIFSCLLYTDDAVRRLIKSYEKRSDFKNSIFIITGDHRLIPIPSDNPLARFHVPLIIFSPMISKPQTFSSLAVHANIPPTVLGLLSTKYNLSFPNKMPFIASSLSVDTSFSSVLDLALIRNKNEITCYVEGNKFLADDRLFTILPNNETQLSDDHVTMKRLKQKLDAFNAKSFFACEQNRIDRPIEHYVASAFTFTKDEEDYLKQEKIRSLNPDQQFQKARELAFAKDYVHSRIISRSILDGSPNYHDARILLARTFAWDGHYDSARSVLTDVLRRAPAYDDTYSALSDIEYWDGHADKSFAWAEEGLKLNHGNVELLARKARGLLMLKKENEARKIVDQVLQKNPQQEIALDLKNKLK